MSDITRSTFRPENRYRSVHMQQGRVQLDADWNEQADIQAYRERVIASGIVGTTGVPWTDFSRGGFEIRSGVVGRSLHAVALASPTVAVAVGGDATVLRTTDGANTWTRRQVDTPRPDTVLRAAAFVSAAEGVVVGDGSTVLHTTDGGTTWGRVAAPEDLAEDLYAVHLLRDRKRWVVAGAGGTILTSDNSGQTWVSRPTGVTATLRGVRFAADENIGIAVGDNATILATDDGGLTWRPRTAPAAVSETLHSVDLRGRQAAAVGDNATVITTEDAGLNWTLITRLAEAPRTLHSVRNISAGGWVAVGGDRTVISNDSAATWSLGFIGDEITATARGVDFLPSGRGVLVGDGHPARGDEPAAVTTSDGGASWSELTAMPAEFLVTPGSMYVDGVLCENARDLPVQQQPDLPGLALPTTPGDYVFFLDVWDREVTALEHPHLREVALGGPDTTTRVQTVWQVKIGSQVPSTFDEPARLAARGLPQTGAPDPCLVPGGSGYRGLENRCYRVQVLNAAGPGGPVLAWSRDNGSIAAKVLSRDDRLLTVSLPGREVREAFAGAPLVEITDARRVLHGEAGILAELEKVEGDQLVVRAAAGLPGLDPSGTVVRRWDGVISPAAADTWHALEDGVQIRIADGALHPGDHWAVPARTATGDVEWPQDAGQPRFEPPQGIRHGYAELGRWRLAGTGWSMLSDERPLVPSLTALTGLTYLGGDGLEYQPSPTTVVPVSVGTPVRGARVRFIPQSGRVRETANSPLVSFLDVVAHDRVARCQWLPDSEGSTTDKRIVAQLVRSFRQDPFPGIDNDTARNGLGHPIAFTARPVGGTAVSDVREQLYAGLTAGTGDGVGFTPGGPAFAFEFGGSEGFLNNFLFLGGKVIAGGRPASLPDTLLRYSEQPWTDPAKAAADGVPMIPALNTPTADRIDLVYADVWEGSTKREIAVRVSEGNATQNPPPPPPGHIHLALLRFHRPGGAARIEFAHVEDIRPQFNQAHRNKRLRLPPIFNSFPGEPEWRYKYTEQGLTAKKSAGLSAVGLIPLALPDGALLSRLTVSGTSTSGEAFDAVSIGLYRTGPNPFDLTLLSDFVADKGLWSRTLTLSRRVRLEAGVFSCFFMASADGNGTVVELHEIIVEYDY